MKSSNRLMFVANLKRRLILLIVFGLLSLPVQAQLRRGARGRVYTKAEVNELIKNAEDRSGRFVKL